MRVLVDTALARPTLALYMVRPDGSEERRFLAGSALRCCIVETIRVPPLSLARAPAKGGKRGCRTLQRDYADALRERLDVLTRRYTAFPHFAGLLAGDLPSPLTTERVDEVRLLVGAYGAAKERGLSFVRPGGTQQRSRSTDLAPA